MHIMRVLLYNIIFVLISAFDRYGRCFKSVHYYYYLNQKKTLMQSHVAHSQVNPPSVCSGKMTAEVKGPSGLIPVTVDDSTVGRSSVVFTPREEGQFE